MPIGKSILLIGFKICGSTTPNMHMTYTYRELVLSDVLEVLVLEQRYCDDTPVVYNDFLTQILNDRFSFVCEYNRRIIGFVKSEVDAKTMMASITVLCVSIAHRRLGIGMCLLRNAVDSILKQGPAMIDHISIFVSPGNLPAIELYQKAGFVFDKKVPEFFSDRTAANKMVLYRHGI